MLAHVAACVRARACAACRCVAAQISLLDGGSGGGGQLNVMQELVHLGLLFSRRFTVRSAACLWTLLTVGAARGFTAPGAGPWQRRGDAGRKGGCSAAGAWRC